MLQALGLNAANPVCVMTQDTARNFLAGSSTKVCNACCGPSLGCPAAVCHGTCLHCTVLVCDLPRWHVPRRSSSRPAAFYL